MTTVPEELKRICSSAALNKEASILQKTQEMWGKSRNSNTNM